MIRFENTFRFALWSMFFLFAVAVCLPALKLPGAYSILNRPTSFLRAASASPETVLPAKIEAYRVSTMVADYPAVVAAAPVSPGIDIEEGQTVALLRSDELIAEKKRAERRLELAQSRYAAATGTDSEESRIRYRQEELVVAERNRRAVLERLRNYSAADVEQAYSNAQRRASDIRDLFEQRLASQYEYDEAVERERAELRNWKAARDHESRVRQEADLADGHVRMLQIQARMNQGLDLKSAQSEVSEASEALRAAERRFAACEVRARIGGTVLQTFVKPGDTVTAGSPLVQIADLRQLTFEAPVGARIARNISAGAPVMLRVPTDPPTRVPGSVSSVSSAPDPVKQAYIVRVSVPNPDPKTVLVGLEGAVEIRHVERK